MSAVIMGADDCFYIVNIRFSIKYIAETIRRFQNQFAVKH